MPIRRTTRLSRQDVRRGCALYHAGQETRAVRDAVTRIRDELLRVRSAGLDFLYPPACALCDASLHRVSESNSPADRLCPECVAGIAPGIPDRCVRCSAPVGPFLDTREGCIHCRTDAFAFERVLSIGLYDATLRQACLAAKQGDAGLSNAMAELLWSVASEELGSAGIDVIVPVPHHWTERMARRHLPPESMARGLARLLRAPVETHLLVKTRRTPAQTDLTPTERRANLRNAFACPGVDMRGATVLLVDDVLTTGTTAHRCSLELRRAGAGRIVVAVAARGIGRPSVRAG